MKPIEDVVCCVLDYGSFISLADTMGKKCKKSFYYSPFEQEYLGIERCCIGDGMDRFTRVDEYMRPDFFDSVDLWIVPDIGFGGFQKYLRSLGKAVFGSMGADRLELYRTHFLKTIKECGLPVVNSEVCHGFSELYDYLKETNNKWVKINRYRANMETWHHIDFAHSERELERLAYTFGPLREGIVFVVQDPIEEDESSPVLEVGYDGWCIDGWFADLSFQGYEAKNELYLGSLLEYEKQPKAVREVNERFSSVLEKYGYRNFFATEIRIKNDVGYFTDPTNRMAGQTMEHLLNTCTNLPEVINAGAHGEIIKPEFSHKFAAEATLHYKGGGDGWKTFTVPDSISEKMKPYRCCFAEGSFHLPPNKSDELGVIIGQGDSVEECITDLNRNFSQLENEPIWIDYEGFADLIAQIQDAETQGIEFSNQEMPKPEIVLEETKG